MTLEFTLWHSSSHSDIAGVIRLHLVRLLLLLSMRRVPFSPLRFRASDVRLVCKHSVEVDLQISEGVCSSLMSESKGTAGTACPASLLLKAHYRVGPLLGVISVSVFWYHQSMALWTYTFCYHCDSIFSRSWAAVTGVWVCLTVYWISPSSTSTRIRPSLFKSTTFPSVYNIENWGKTRAL